MNQQLQIPKDIAAEQALLGAILERNDLLDTALPLLDAQAFYNEHHRSIFKGMQRLYDTNTPIDVVSLSSNLQRSGESVESDYLEQDLYNVAPINANESLIREYCRIISDHAVMRELMKSSGQIVRLSGDPTKNAEEALSEALEKIQKIGDKQPSDTADLKSTLGSTVRHMMELEERADDSNMIGLPTGFTELDNYLQGLIKKDLIIVAARPSVGKTAFALTIAHQLITRQDIDVRGLFISREMDKEQLAMRLLAIDSRVALNKIRSANMEEDDWGRLYKSVNFLSGNPKLFINESAKTISDIRSEVRKLQRTSGIGFLIIDYLQLLKEPSLQKNREQEIAYISRSLKEIAKDFNIPVIALSQLNRALENRTDKIPKLSDLRESGAIEQDADIIMFLHREEVYEKDTPRKGEADVKIGKHRNGPLGDIILGYVGRNTRFTNPSERPYR